MARIFSEGFEMGDRLAFTYQGGTISTSPARSGTYSLLLTGQECYKTISPVSELYMRLGLWQSTLSRPDVRFQNDTTVLVNVKSVWGTERYLGIYIGGSLVSVGTVATPSNGWCIVEVYVKIHDTEGIVELKINDVLVNSFYGDTLVGANSTLNRIDFEQDNGSANLYIDDIAINDTTGSIDNSWCGDGHIIRVAPNASGSSSMFVGNDGDSVDNYLLVDEIPQDGDTTTAIGENVGDYDLYNFADSGLPAEQIIKRVWVEGTAKDPDTGDVSMLIQSGSTLAEDDADQQLGSAWGRVKSDEYTVNPNTGEAWTEEELNAIQAGMKVKS